MTADPTTDVPADVADIAVETLEAPAPEAAPALVPTFVEHGVQQAIADALAVKGIERPFPIQAMTLPVALSGHDIIGQAKTGTGKTLGFGIPAVQRAVGPGEEGWDDLLEPGSPQALVVVPTRELAVQVSGDLTAAAARRSVRVLTIYGGRAYEPQVEALEKGVEVVVGTPGRLLDLANQGKLRLGHARTVVLDEADEMLDLGFLPDVEKILAMTPAGRQTMLFSATMPGPVVALARRYMTQPTHIRASEPDDVGATVKATRQVVYRAHAMDKVEVLARLLQAEGRGLSIVFTRTKRTAAKVADDLAERGFAAGALHGDLGQGAREQALRAFRSGKVDVLVATDVAARGIDVTDVTHVVNYQCPEDDKTYVHRIGRTGRAGQKGIAVTFVDWDDVPRWGLIDKTLDLGIPAPVETYSTSPHLFSDLDIPAGTTGRLPRSRRTRAGLGAEVLEDLGETGRSGGGRDGARGSRDGGSRDGAPRGGSARSGDQERAPRAEGDGDAPGRRRRRSRGGEGSTGDAPTTTTTAADEAPARSGSAPTDGGDQGAEGDAAGRRPRRRRRGGRGGGQAGEAQAGEARSGEARSGEARSGEAQSGGAQSGEARATEATSGDAKSRGARSGGATSGGARSGGAQGGRSLPSGALASGSLPDSVRSGSGGDRAAES
ncbi:DEAD/DEAH box helicase [uncultured Pseudokineococcus sp.]|uniref:DEAD/DEAH box helicase n=1 Tax=uncultured Pseudokineococcus sp. TaxID=1642928 RepID=UPI00262FDA69|nr:DEAD/DEAH box helicase [uncultured Pseudokineococcus sp.]